MATRHYLDHAATTPIRPEAAAAIAGGLARWANPSSPHAEGRAARAALEDARARIKAALGWDHHLIFTSGASEALALALRRAKADRRLVAAAEHDAVLRAAPDAELLPMRGFGVDPEAFAEKLAQGGRAIVAIQQLNPETGSLVLDAAAAEIAHRAGAILLSDCAQSAGKMALPEADLIVVSAHKLGGPPGIGALLVRDLGLIAAGGGQEQGYRGGTENLPAALGFAAALEARDHWADFGLDAALAVFKAQVAEAGGEIVDANSRLILAIAMPALSAAAQLIRFDRLGFSVSAGSACASGSLKPSRVLKAFGVADEVAARTIRISAGWTTTSEEIAAFAAAWLGLADEARRRAA